MPGKGLFGLAARLRRSRIPFFPLTLILASVAAGQGGEFWQKKDYRQWSEGECRRLLENSPWAKTHTLAEVFIEPLQTPRSVPTPPLQVPDPNSGAVRSSTAERAREQNPKIRYLAQFRSALPIRQALVRLMQINQKYDQMQPEQKQAFEQNAEQFLAKQFPDSVVVNVAVNSNVQEYQLELSRYWQSQTTESLKNSTFLIGSKGERIPLQSYICAANGREFQLTFPRQYKDHAVIGPGDRALQLEFLHPRIRQQRESRVLIEFKSEKVSMEGSVVY